MSGRRLQLVRAVLAVALVLQGAVVLSLGATAPGAALSPDGGDAGVTVETRALVENTTNTTTDDVDGDASSTVNETSSTDTVVTSDVTGSAERAGTNGTTDASIESTPDATASADNVDEPASGVIATIDETVSRTVDDELVGVIASPDGTVVLAASDSGVDHSIGEDTSEAEAGSAERSTSAGDAPGAPSGDGGLPGSDVPSLPAGAAAVGALAVATAAGRQGLAVLQSSPRPGPSAIRAAGGRLADGEGWWRDWAWRVLGLLGYQRYDDSDPLEHEARATIHEHLQRTPGTYLSAISDETGIPLPTVRYHLRILEHEGLVSPTKIRGKRRYFPAGTEPSELEAALDDDGSAAVLEALARDGLDSVSGLAETLDRDASTITYHLQRLEDADLVVRERDGPAVVNRLAPEVRATLVRPGSEPASADARAPVSSSD